MRVGRVVCGMVDLQYSFTSGVTSSRSGVDTVIADIGVATGSASFTSWART